MRTYRSGLTLSRRRPSPAPHLQLARSAESGQPLEADTRGFMESRFERDFSGVRVHTTSDAAESADSLNARAYTTGNHIAFGTGEYDPASARGQHLLAHELAHVAQNGTTAPVETAKLTSPGDAREIEAESAVSAVFSGNKPSIAARSGPMVARQTPGPLAPTRAALPSQGESVVKSFLQQMWDKQSGGTEDFVFTAKVQEGLSYVSPFISTSQGVLTKYKSPDEFLDRIRGSIPETIDANVIKVLDRLPNQEKKLADARKPDPNADPAKPKLPDQITGPPNYGREKPKQPSDAAAAALSQAYDQFSKTELGKQLGKALKSYVLSVDGVPFDIIVAEEVVTFVAANDPKLPGVPEIPLGDGVKLKIDYSGKASDLPPLVRDLLHGHSTQSQKPGPDGYPPDEKKIGLSVTLTNDAVIELGKSVGHFFAEAGRWFAQGVIGIGTAIRKAGVSIGDVLLASAGGGALGALIGGLAGGGKGALIGLGVGALVAGAATFIGEHFGNKPKLDQKTPEQEKPDPKKQEQTT